MVLFRDRTCQNRAKRDFGSPDREKEPFDRGIENFARRNETLPKSFTTEEASQFQRHRYIFFAADTR